jgi:hypothetical protein
MNRLRLLVLLPVLAVLALLGAAPASAKTTPQQVATALQGNPVYVESDAEHAGDVDAGKVRSQIGNSSRRIYVAVLPARAGAAYGGARGVALAVSHALGTGTVVLALVGDEVTAVSAPGSGFANGQAESAVAGVSGGATDRLVEAVRNLQSAQLSSGGGGTGGGGSSSSGGGHGGAILGVLAVGAAGGGALLYGRSRKRRQRELDGLRADVESLYNRLGSDVSTLAPGDDAVVKQALSDAAERYNATGALLATADTPGEFSAARRTAVEGLVAAQTARKKLGLDPGPEIPLPGSGPQLTAEQKVRVGDQEYDGSPTYAPGRGHYYGGGYYNGQVVPGGWYAFPFWETMLMTSMLGGFGGGFGGGGYGAGYQEGVEDARDNGGNGGGDWGGGGGGGGGDWGGGGGDWGGGGGGGGDGW